MKNRTGQLPPPHHQNVERWIVMALLLLLTGCSTGKRVQSRADANRIGLVADEFFNVTRTFPGLDATELLARASYATIEWPQHPGWRYVMTDTDGLIMAAHESWETLQTQVRVPLEEGSYVLFTPALLRANCQYPVIIALSIANANTPLLKKILKPGAKELLAEPFRIPKAGKELQLTLTMAPGAANNYFATVTFFKFRIVKIEGA